MTLDDCVQALGLRNIDFIKLDVSGNEPSVLKGAQNMLARMRPVVISQFAPYLHGEAFAPMIALLRELDYRAETKLDKRPVDLTPESVAAECERGRGVDLILRPIT